jgi:hypothetical protein
MQTLQNGRCCCVFCPLKFAKRCGYYCCNCQGKCEWNLADKQTSTPALRQHRKERRFRANYEAGDGFR